MLVSEVMLQQTPVHRVLPVYLSWMGRWPTPDRLAAEPAAEAIRAWGRLGYPRRALRLHAAARLITQRHAGEVPRTAEELHALPGVGHYTAAAVLAFAYGQRVAVLDTNVRRVLSRLVTGQAVPGAQPTRAERDTATALLPDSPAVAARWSVAVMELGALVCRSRTPDCPRCPVAADCRWLDAGCPPAARARRTQPFAGTDRQVRGLMLDLLRAEPTQVPRDRLLACWSQPQQAARALDSLVADGLVETDDAGAVRLPA